MHYTDMQFLNQRDEAARQKALVFDGIHYLHVFYYLMTSQYHQLPTNLVNIHNMFESGDKAIDLMKECTRSIPPVPAL